MLTITPSRQPNVSHTYEYYVQDDGQTINEAKATSNSHIIY